MNGPGASTGISARRRDGGPALRRLAPLALALALVACRGSAAHPAAGGSAPANAAVAGSDSLRMLIEMGWDQPDTRFLRRHIAEMLRTPFDGTVVRLVVPDHDTTVNVSWGMWGRRRFTAGQLQPALDDLRATPLGAFRRSLVRINATPGDLDWFDDHSAVWSNLELAARIAHDGGFAGVMMDFESYKSELWDYRVQTRARPRSWEEMTARVRQSGREAMAALQRGFPDLVVFTTFAYSLPFQQTYHGTSPLQDGKYGLLPAFLDGMLDAATGGTILVDGQEQFFTRQNPADYAAGADSLRHAALRIVGVDPERYRRFVRVGFGLWLDHGADEGTWELKNPERNYYPPATAETMLKAAARYGDGYVWVYSHKLQWWSERGGPANLAPEYDGVLRRARGGAGRLTPPH